VVGAETSVGRVRGTAAGRDTRRRILAAVVETLRRDGVAGVTARGVGRTGGFNQALVFYHFGTIEGVLLATVDDLTERRLPAYRAALAGVTTVAEVGTALAPLVVEDVRDGHLPAVAALVAGTASSSGLAAGLGPRLAPWLRLAEDVAARVGAPGRSPTDVAVAAVAAGLGLGLLGRLPGAPSPEALGALVARLLPPAP
jgi:AcrR family transcriptional regulator